MFEGAKRSQAAIDEANEEWRHYDRVRRDLPPEEFEAVPHRRQALSALVGVFAFGFGALGHDDVWARRSAAVACGLWAVIGIQAALAWRAESVTRR